MTAARMRARWSGGKGRRVSDLAVDDPHGAQELHAVGIDVSLGGRPAYQGADGMVGEQVAVDFLADHVRAFLIAGSCPGRAGGS